MWAGDKMSPINGRHSSSSSSSFFPSPSSSKSTPDFDCCSSSSVSSGSSYSSGLPVSTAPNAEHDKDLSDHRCGHHRLHHHRRHHHHHHHHLCHNSDTTSHHTNVTTSATRDNTNKGQFCLCRRRRRRQISQYGTGNRDKRVASVCHTRRSLSALFVSSSRKPASRSEDEGAIDHTEGSSLGALAWRWTAQISSQQQQHCRKLTTRANLGWQAATTMISDLGGSRRSGRRLGGGSVSSKLGGKTSKLGAISLVTFLIILAHICLHSRLHPAVRVAHAQDVRSTGKSANFDNLLPSDSLVEAALVETRSLDAGSDGTFSTPARAQPQPQPQPQAAAAATAKPAGAEESWRSRPQSMRDMRDARFSDKKLLVNMSNVFEVLLKKRPYSKYWTVEQKWDDLFTRAMAVQGTMRSMMMKNFMRDIEYYADMTVSPACEKDLKYIQSYMRQSTNFRWLAHMFDATGKSEPGMLTGMLAHMGHPVQCIRVRAPARPSNDSFDERFFEQQTQVLGERFRGKYCLASVRPVLPPKPANVVVSRFSDLMNASLLSNISYTGEPAARLKQRAHQMTVPSSIHSTIDREHLRLDQVPFESELYQYLIAQRNFVFALPRLMGVCYPSSCTRDDVRISLQKSLDEQHQVVDIEFECEQEEFSSWNWFNTPRLIAYVILGLVSGLVFMVSFTRYVLLSKLQVRRDKLPASSKMAGLLDALEMFSMDKCAGILFVKTKRASPLVDWTKVENNRSTTIDALKGLLVLLLVYAQMTLLGCLPLPFMWAKWSDAMFPFYRSLSTQLFINMSIWSEAFYMISAYLIALKVLENYRPKLTSGEKVTRADIVSGCLSKSGSPFGGSDSPLVRGSSGSSCRVPSFFSFAIKRYLRLAMPMLAFILLNYVWPRLSNGFVMQDQASKLMRPCDTFGWTNFLIFHNNHNQLNETCLWPSHASASFFQLHLLSYPILVLCIMALYSQFNQLGGNHDEDYDGNKGQRQHRLALARVLTWLTFGLMALLGLLGLIYPALQASKRSLIVPFLIDYLDYDNYRRVLEWTVMPTYNHLTSYMFGIALAFIVIKRKASAELRRLEASQWYGCGSGGGGGGVAGQYTQREGSVDSIRSSSTQELHQKQQQQLSHHNVQVPPQQPIKHFTTGTSSGESSMCDDAASNHDGADDGDASLCDHSSSQSNSASSSWSRIVASFSSGLVCLGSLCASWLWNGLGQPMSDEQTFWYMVLTKFCFCTTFAYLFFAHFATRRNSSNPWMLTRFLVPIGRMSLTVFYTSWLVIWFDLLASLHQWHPSHYFICEKYSEIIFITLIVAMFVYGAFEGIIKRIQYSARLESVKHDIRLRMSLATDGVGYSTDNNNNNNNNKGFGHVVHKRTFKVKPFESFFDARDKPTWEELSLEYKLNAEGEDRLNLADDRKTTNTTTTTISGDAGCGGTGTGAAHSMSIFVTDEQQQQQQRQRAQTIAGASRSPAYLKAPGDASAGRAGGGGGGELTPSATSINLSPSDRYKLNAELRANYSFASIGLYESAGATGDLSNLASKH